MHSVPKEAALTRSVSAGVVCQCMQPVDWHVDVCHARTSSVYSATPVRAHGLCSDRHIIIRIFFFGSVATYRHLDYCTRNGPCGWGEREGGGGSARKTQMGRQKQIAFVFCHQALTERCQQCRLLLPLTGARSIPRWFWGGMETVKSACSR